MKSIDVAWFSTGGTSGGAGAANTFDHGPTQIFEQPWQAAILVEHSSGCTMTLAFETAMESTGPWAAVASTTTNSSLAECFYMPVTGPFGEWVRPRFVSAPTTGFFRVKFTGVD